MQLSNFIRRFNPWDSTKKAEPETEGTELITINDTSEQHPTKWASRLIKEAPALPQKNVSFVVISPSKEKNEVSIELPDTKLAPFSKGADILLTVLPPPCEEEQDFVFVDAKDNQSPNPTLSQKAHSYATNAATSITTAATNAILNFGCGVAANAIFTEPVTQAVVDNIKEQVINACGKITVAKAIGNAAAAAAYPEVRTTVSKIVTNIGKKHLRFLSLLMT